MVQLLITSNFFDCNKFSSQDTINKKQWEMIKKNFRLLRLEIATVPYDYTTVPKEKVSGKMPLIPYVRIFNFPIISLAYSTNGEYNCHGQT